MSMAGVLILVGFFLFAGLMVARLIPPLLALPLMAAWIAWVVQLPLTAYLNGILLGGAMKLASAMAVVIFGAMFARVIMKTGISDTIIKKAAELAGDQPFSIALILTAATAFVFLGMSGLGAIIMVGSISIPIMTSAGISPLHASVLLLLGMQTGLLANAANYGTFIGIFGGAVTAAYYLPAALTAGIGALVYIWRNVEQPKTAGGSFLGIVRAFLLGLLSVPGSLVHTLLHRENTDSLLKKKRRVPAAALLAPVIPLVTVYAFKGLVGFGPADRGMVDPVAASVFGFILASAYASLLTRPAEIVNVFAGAIVEGIRDVAGVLFLFMGIGMLVAAVMHPMVSAVLNPMLASIVPASRWGMFLFFLLLAPTALYRGPLNMFGMGAGIAVLLVSLDILPLPVVCGTFMGVQYVQGVSDPTNSHNTWIGGYAGVDTAVILRKTLPYTWGMCLVMLLYVALTQW